MPKKPVQGLTGRMIRCILFDLGDTLWSRGSDQTWERLETTGDLQAGALLRKHIASQLLPGLDDRTLDLEVGVQ